MQVDEVLGNIRAELGRQRMSQTDLAKALGISQQNVSARLSGRVVIDLRELTVIADVLEVSVESLMAPRQVPA